MCGPRVGNINNVPKAGFSRYGGGVFNENFGKEM
jgi:hypothetical protein